MNNKDFELSEVIYASIPNILPFFIIILFRSYIILNEKINFK